jgi:RHS repeat-associated protein
VSYYGYDELNRLSRVDELPIASWVSPNIGWLPQAYSQRYNYDRYGNRTLNTVGTWGIGINRKAFTAKTANNRLVAAPNDTGDETSNELMRYDKVGNLIYDAYTGAGARVYDAENRLTSAVGNGGTSSYVYDGDGRRVRRLAAGQPEVWQIYGAGGELLAEYPVNGVATAPQKEYGYRNGRLLLVAQSSPFELRWQVADHLGTPRMSVRGTGADGGSLASVTRHDYLPFGEELPAGMGVRSTGTGYIEDNARMKYVGYERDSETGLDFAQARYYSSSQGRFTRPDAPLIDQWESEPQSWNLYSYVRNNPLRYTDPTGQYKCDN